MKIYLFKKRITALLTTFFCAGTLLAGTFFVPAPLNGKAEITEINNPIGYATNILKCEFGESLISSPVLDSTFIASDEIRFLSTEEHKKEVLGGKSYNSYKSLAEDVSHDWKIKTNITTDGYFFLAEIQKNIGSSLSAAQHQYATQYYYRYGDYYTEYSLTLENSAYFSDAYADKLNSVFLDALDKLSSGELSYTDFFDTFGTHVITGADFGTKFEAYYGCFFDRFLNDKEWDELDKIVKASLNSFLENGGEGRWEPNHEVSKKFGLNPCVSYTTNVDMYEGEYLAVGFSNLLPFYEILPEKYSALAAPMKQAFEEYAEKNTHLYENTSLPEPSPDSSATPISPPENDEGDGKGLKIALICTAAVAVSAGVAIGFTLYFRKKKKP